MTTSVNTSNSYTEQDIQQLVEQLMPVKNAIGKVIVGQEDVVEQLLIGLLAGGHCLLEGVPGLGKTLLVKSLSEAMHIDFNRIQFTPDLMPSDVIGTEILEEDHSTGKRFFKFQKGPVFTNILLADEINRTPPKTQASLLEAMQEKSVSYAGETYQLDAPFFVLATQNPLEQAGTYPLPEAQLDRFLLFISVDYPSEIEELEILNRTTGAKVSEVERVLDKDSLLKLQQLTREVSISPSMLAWITRLVRESRPEQSSVSTVTEWVKWGAGPRAGQALVLCSKARAILHGRLAVSRDDIEALLPSVLQHRILLSFHAEAEKKSIKDITDALLKEISIPESDIKV